MDEGNKPANERYGFESKGKKGLEGLSWPLRDGPERDGCIPDAEKSFRTGHKGSGTGRERFRDRVMDRGIGPLRGMGSRDEQKGAGIP